MKMIPVASSHLAAVGYDTVSRNLHIEFQGGGQITHVGVPPEEHSALMGAPSHGRHYHAHIKSTYKTGDQERSSDRSMPLQDAPGAGDAERYPRAPQNAESPRSLDEAIEHFRGNHG